MCYRASRSAYLRPGSAERRRGIAVILVAPVYAVIKTGGKQERVEEGQRVGVELLGAAEGDEVSFAPVLVVDGDHRAGHARRALWSERERHGSSASKGPKVRGFIYKNKTRGRRSWGHRQRYTTIEVTAITREA